MDFDPGPEFFSGREDLPMNSSSPFVSWLSPADSVASGLSSGSNSTPTPRQNTPLQTPPPTRLGNRPPSSVSSGRRRHPTRHLPSFHDPEVETFLQDVQNRRHTMTLGGEDSDDDPFHSSPMALMALFYQKQQLAISLFDVEGTALRVCQFYYWPQNGECALLQNLILEHRVTKIVVASNLDKGFLDEIQGIRTMVPHELHIVAVGTKEFSLESAIFRVRMLRYSDEDASSKGFHTPFDDLSALDDPLILRSAGALLNFALRESIVNELEGASSPILISQIEVIDSTGRLLMDIGSYDSLQIFKVEHHPSVSGIGVKKEGWLRVMGLLFLLGL